jgi:uncharacterized membrane protein YfcA
MLRIRKTRWKVAYFVVTLVLVGVLGGFVVRPYLPDPIGVIVGNLLMLVLVFGAARSFRGQGEPIRPPRAWWRGSARPTASFVLGALWAVDAVVAIIQLALQAEGVSAVAVISNVLLAAFFLNSGVRLRRFPQPLVSDPIPAPRFKPIKR